MSKIANFLLGQAKNVASNRGSKLKITLSENGIEYEYSKPKKDDTEVWENYYANAGLFLSNTIQEIKINSEDLRNERFKLVEKARLEPVFKANLARSLWGFAIQDDNQTKLTWVAIAGIGLILLLQVM